jgi:lysophospholipase L1-like esterase
MNNTIKSIVLITLPTLLVVFFILEVAVRLLLPRTDLDELTGRNQTINPMSEWAINDPYCAYSPKVGLYGENKTVNSAGFISTPEIQLEKDTNTLRILFLGESSTAGTGTNLPDTITWPWRTVEKLRQTGSTKKIEFINGALGGYCSFESYGRLWSRLRFYKPDVIVVNHGWNDMYYFTMTDSIQNYKRDFSVKKLTTLPLIKPHWIDPYCSWSQLLARIRIKIIGGMDPTDGEINDTSGGQYANNYDATAIEVYRDNLEFIQTFGKSFNIPVFACKQATLIAPATSDADKARCRYGYHKLNHEAHLKAYSEIYACLDDIYGKEHIIDLSSLNGISTYFHDHVHPTDAGTAVIAQIVADSLNKNFLSTLAY